MGTTRFRDQFIWDVNSPSASPEEFALQLGKDLSLDPAIVVEVACAIREQVRHPRLPLATQAYPSRQSPSPLCFSDTLARTLRALSTLLVPWFYAHRNVYFRVLLQLKHVDLSQCNDVLPAS